MKAAHLALLPAALSLVGAAAAQTKISIHEQCGRPTAEYTIPAGDHAGHLFRIEQTNCAPQGQLEIGGVAVEQHQVTGFSEMDGAKGEDQWFHVFSMANGDRAYARSAGGRQLHGWPLPFIHRQVELCGRNGEVPGPEGRRFIRVPPLDGRIRL